MFTMSTTSRSPGSTPSKANGPLSMWQGSMFMSRMSSALSSLRTWLSVQSLHSIRYVEPVRSVAAGGMSGCQRLCPGTTWSRIDTFRSRLTSKTTSGMELLIPRAGGRAVSGAHPVTDTTGAVASGGLRRGVERQDRPVRVG